MPFLELFDETLDINSTENYELSVQVSVDDLSFCILDTLRNKFVLLRSYEPEDNSRFDPFRLNEIIKKDDFLIRHYRKTKIITPTSKSTIVPSPLFDDSKKAEYLAFNQIPSDGKRVLANKLRDPDVAIIFSLPEGIADILNSTFPGNLLIHQLIPLFHYIKADRRSVGNNNVYVHLEGDYLNMVIFDQNTLKFCNTFHYKTISDIEYYVLYVLKRMNVSQDNAVYFSGRLIKQEEVLHAFSNYLRNIRFPVPEGKYTFSYVFNEKELNKFLILFTTASCE
ncbi:MAG: DUF3822 family protein [Bacteroidia bacterium]|jgi:hypothetical protein|nr:DUF3822 family protein [Bacteroidia bacterium]